jgi:hypothetical protein
VTRGLTSRGTDGCDPLEWIVTGAPAVLQPLILEPASWSTGAVYLRGAYTALGTDDQLRLIATLPGLEQARLLRAGMLVEYDGLAAGVLGSDLGVRGQLGLYAAGAFAGGNGNEESAALGLVAGINAARYTQQRAAVVFEATNTYTGVLIDLVSRGIGAPYRIANAQIADLSRRSDLKCLSPADAAGREPWAGRDGGCSDSLPEAARDRHGDRCSAGSARGAISVWAHTWPQSAWSRCERWSPLMGCSADHTQPTPPAAAGT